MTNRRKPAQRPTTAAWKPTRPRSELYKAIGAGAGVALVTVLAIVVMKPADSPSTPATNTPLTTPATPSTDTTGTLPASTAPGAPSSSSTTTPAKP